MSAFPTTTIEELTVSRLLIGTNWFMGHSHQTAAKSRFIRKLHAEPESIAEIMEVFLNAGINATVGSPQIETFHRAVQIAQERTGKTLHILSLVTLPLDNDDEVARLLDEQAALGTAICLPHQQTTDALVDRGTRTIRRMDRYCQMIRERGMKPGLSTHMPEAPVYADETGLDVATYLQIYNAAGFLMQIEIDWVHRMIWERQRPVVTIKPLAAGRLQPLVGLAFSWATLRPCDMVTVGCLTPDEARECIDISLSLLEQRGPATELQRTRSKTSIDGN